MIRRFLSILDARNKEFLRDRAALSWNILFPLIIVIGFAFANSGKSQDLFKVSVVSDAQTVKDHFDFLKTNYVQFIDSQSLSDSLLKLRRHRVDMVLSLGEKNKYWINVSSPKGYLLEKILAGSQETHASFTKQTVEGQEIRYVDWLIAGILGMNMMFSAFFGVGFTIVRYRKNAVLKRLKATPLTAFEFLMAQIFSRLILIIGVSVIVFFLSNLLIHYRMLGSYFDLFLVLTLGAVCLISLGLLMASRVSSEEFAGGLLNLMSWPMMFLSGVWFSLEGAHPVVQKLAQIFPLTHVIESARAIMNEGATLTQISGHLLTLSIMTCLFLGVSSLIFKWE